MPLFTMRHFAKNAESFSEDIKHAKKLNAKQWYERSLLTQFPEKLARPAFTFFVIIWFDEVVQFPSIR
jgi:hypothetical protein